MAFRKVITSLCNWATESFSFWFSAWRNASILIGLQSVLPWFCSGKLDSIFGVFNPQILLIALLLRSIALHKNELMACHCSMNSTQPCWSVRPGFCVEITFVETTGFSPSAFAREPRAAPLDGRLRHDDP